MAFGTERTIEQDPMFAFRILTDIALKALSPAINDPTTAVLALDQLQRLLRVVGGLREGFLAVLPFVRRRPLAAELADRRVERAAQVLRADRLAHVDRLLDVIEPGLAPLGVG